MKKKILLYGEPQEGSFKITSQLPKDATIIEHDKLQRLINKTMERSIDINGIKITATEKEFSDLPIFDIEKHITE
jgi:hypothetical protein